MPTTLLTPVDRGKARPSGASRLWRKQILPVGEISYKGRKIAFTPEYLTGLAKAFTARAFDQVPFQLAPGDNSHTNDPERFRGEVRGFEATDDGLDLILAATEDGDKVLRANPALGVSARIVEDYQRADGAFFPAAIQHVLGTLDPRITGMRPWQAIEAANDAGEIIDLTDGQYDAYDKGGTLPPAKTPAVNDSGQPETVQQPPGTPATEEHHMAFTADQEARLGRLLDLPDDKFTQLLAAAEPPAGGTEGDGDTELSDEELQELIDGLDDDGASEGGEGDANAGDQATAASSSSSSAAEPAGAALSADALAQINLANSRAEETSLELARVTTALNRAAYERERDHFSREYGIPPRITDLARTVLEGEGHVVELSNGSSIDAGAVVRKVLKEIGQTVRMLDLSGELGTPLDFSADAERAAEEKAVTDRKALVSEFRRTTGV